MDFDFSEDQQALRDAVRRFVDKDYGFERRTQIERAGGFDRAAWEGLAGLGAPLNTLAPSGVMRLSWTALELVLTDRQVAINGRTTLEMTDMGSRLSAIRPLGSYALALDWHGQAAALTLNSVKGPLLLSGSGNLNNGRLQFSGQAEAAKGYEEQLANLLNLLGQRKPGSDRNVIALEFH